MAGEPVPDPSPAVAAVLAHLEADWVTLEDELTDRVPWAFWPLWQPTVGRGTVLNVVWLRAEPMWAAVIQAAGRCGLTVVDPEEEVVVPPRSVSEVVELAGQESATRLGLTDRLTPRPLTVIQVLLMVRRVWV